MTTRLFLGYDFHEFMSDIGSGSYRHPSDILNSEKTIWLTSNSKKFNLKKELKLPSKSYHSRETVRCDFEEDQKYPYEPINKFFEWNGLNREDYLKNLECKTAEKKKKKAKPVLKKKKSGRLLVNKLLKSWMRF